MLPSSHLRTNWLQLAYVADLDKFSGQQANVRTWAFKFTDSQIWWGFDHHVDDFCNNVKLIRDTESSY